MNRLARTLAAVLLVVSLASGPAAVACTTFVLHDGQELVVGKNYDFCTDNGRVMTNQRGVSKHALLMGPGIPARWVSRYGSITFNQVGKEYPIGGMNEAGLVVETMSVEAASFPAPDDRPALSELQWVQYQLDNCATVGEVMATNAAIRIERPGQPVHFLVADRQGSVATVEFLAGQFVCHTGDSLLVPVLTNNTYEASAAYLCRHVGFGGSEPPAPSSASLDRFTNAAVMLCGPAALHRGKPDQRAFQILHAVAIPNYTVWSIVYDLPRGRIHFHTTADRTLRHVDLGDFEFDCARPGRLLDLATRCKGHAAGRFVDYTTELNRALVRGTFVHYRDAKFIDLPAPVQEHLARYPESLSCAPATP